VLLGVDAFHIDLKLCSLLSADSEVKILEFGVGKVLWRRLDFGFCKVLWQQLDPCDVCFIP
jgi:hypothetical protein